jgi:hypothetical protein
MDCVQIHTQLHWIRSATMDARARLDNGDSIGVERSLRAMEKAIQAIRDELKGAKR